MTWPKSPATRHDHEHIVAAILEGICPDCAGRLTPSGKWGHCDPCQYRWAAQIGDDGLSSWSQQVIPPRSLLSPGAMGFELGPVGPDVWLLLSGGT